MKKILLLALILCACTKQSNQPSTQSQQPPTTQSTLHTITYKWIGTNNPIDRWYLKPDNSFAPTIGTYDTITSNTCTFTSQYKEGTPTHYIHRITGTMSTSNDSIKLEIWIDGVLKASSRDLLYVECSYNY